MDKLLFNMHALCVGSIAFNPWILFIYILLDFATFIRTPNPLHRPQGSVTSRKTSEHVPKKNGGRRLAPARRSRDGVTAPKTQPAGQRHDWEVCGGGSAGPDVRARRAAAAQLP